MSMKGNFARSILCSGTTSVDFGSYSSMVSVCCERGVSCCASKGRCDARIIEMAIAAIETRKATLRRKFIEAPRNLSCDVRDHSRFSHARWRAAEIFLVQDLLRS